MGNLLSCHKAVKVDQTVSAQATECVVLQRAANRVAGESVHQQVVTCVAEPITDVQEMQKTMVTEVNIGNGDLANTEGTQDHNLNDIVRISRPNQNKPRRLISSEKTGTLNDADIKTNVEYPWDYGLLPGQVSPEDESSSPRGSEDSLQVVASQTQNKDIPQSVTSKTKTSVQMSGEIFTTFQQSSLPLDPKSANDCRPPDISSVINQENYQDLNANTVHKEERQVERETNHLNVQWKKSLIQVKMTPERDQPAYAKKNFSRCSIVGYESRYPQTTVPWKLGKPSYATNPAWGFTSSLEEAFNSNVPCSDEILEPAAVTGVPIHKLHQEPHQAYSVSYRLKMTKHDPAALRGYGTLQSSDYMIRKFRSRESSVAAAPVATEKQDGQSEKNGSSQCPKEHHDTGSKHDSATPSFTVCAFCSHTTDIGSKGRLTAHQSQQSRPNEAAHGSAAAPAAAVKQDGQGEDDGRSQRPEEHHDTGSKQGSATSSLTRVTDIGSKGRLTAHQSKQKRPDKAVHGSAAAPAAAVKQDGQGEDDGRSQRPELHDTGLLPGSAIPSLTRVNDSRSKSRLTVHQFQQSRPNEAAHGSAAAPATAVKQDRQGEDDGRSQRSEEHHDTGSKQSSATSSFTRVSDNGSTDRLTAHQFQQSRPSEAAHGSAAAPAAAVKQNGQDEDDGRSQRPEEHHDTGSKQGSATSSLTGLGTTNQSKAKKANHDVSARGTAGVIPLEAVKSLEAFSSHSSLSDSTYASDGGSSKSTISTDVELSQTTPKVKMTQSDKLSSSHSLLGPRSAVVTSDTDYGESGAVASPVSSTISTERCDLLTKETQDATKVIKLSPSFSDAAEEEKRPRVTFEEVQDAVNMAILQLKSMQAGDCGHTGSSRGTAYRLKPFERGQSLQGACESVEDCSEHLGQSATKFSSVSTTEFKPEDRASEEETSSNRICVDSAGERRSSATDCTEVATPKDESIEDECDIIPLHRVFGQTNLCTSVTQIPQELPVFGLYAKSPSTGLFIAAGAYQTQKDVEPIMLPERDTTDIAAATTSQQATVESIKDAQLKVADVVESAGEKSEQPWPHREDACHDDEPAPSREIQGKEPRRKTPTPEHSQFAEVVFQSLGPVDPAATNRNAVVPFNPVTDTLSTVGDQGTAQGVRSTHNVQRKAENTSDEHTSKD